jgi:hypothetical protein
MLEIVAVVKSWMMSNPITSEQNGIGYLGFQFAVDPMIR